MSVPALTAGFMDSSHVVGLDALWPEFSGQQRRFEVVVTVPREDGGEPLAPRTLPPEVLTCWSADQVIVSATVVASRLASAAARAPPAWVRSQDGRAASLWATASICRFDGMELRRAA